MTTIFLIRFFLIFTTINANTDPCEKNTACQCLVNDLNKINILHNSLYGPKFGISVKAWSDLQIDCKEMGGWKNFNLTSEQSGKILNSLEFKHCELPNTTKKFGQKIRKELEEVVLSSNAFVNLTENLFWNSSSLKYISLNHNFLETLPQNIFRGLLNVEKLIINNNMIDTLPEGIFKDLKKLKLLDLSINRFVSISRYLFEGLTSLTELNMERNQLKHIEHAALSTIRNLTIARFSYNQLQVDNLTCKHSNGLEGPKINQLDHTTYKCLEHEYFKTLENCQFGCICSIRPYDRTRVLDCSDINMSVFLIDQLKVNFVGNYPLILNLTGNFLTEIPSIEALEPINVTGLLLSNNNISQITVDKLSKSLTVLELHNNNISKLDENVMSYFTTSPFKEFTLSGNPLICNCDTKYVFEYVKIMRFNYKDLNNVKCKNMDLPLYNMTIEQFCPSIPPPSELDYREELN
ncbi:phospholipase A2 inhibitor beta-like [Polistes fuscatus]|uniref:phospholipase A2 inhibitor beta-like n=1 Tax=Polistes fuscatus TaxID=30207 RepID=UPI001CA803CA|nr:phospholipase A2 inhibitor beta-like [Polistes fuscatus]